MKSVQWANIPSELKQFDQWVVAGENKIPLYFNDGRLVNSSVIAPSQWMSFQDASSVAAMYGLDIGFVLCANDPFSCIDLDVKDCENCIDPKLWTTPEQFDLFYRVMQSFNSYTETSRSGKGLHIWLKGKIGKGVRRDGIEIYSQERFIICTGKAILNTPIEERESLLINMASQMRGVAEVVGELVEVEQEEDDWSILMKATEAGNSEKFIRLWRGEWAEMGFPSQSEADLALMSMLTFYSPSNIQCRRLFRESALGQREKAVKNDRYLNYTLSTIRGREQRERAAEVSALVQAADTMLDARRIAQQEVMKMQGGMPAHNAVKGRTIAPLHVLGLGDPTQYSTPTAVAATLTAPVDASVVKVADIGLPWPPGFAGKIAQFIYQSAPRPVKEVAIVATLGLLAGICGKAWHVPQSGLNVYIILIARSAIGKEAMHSGISAIVKAALEKMPHFSNFINFTEFASGPALMKECAGNPSFVNVSGEWGRRLRRLAVSDDKDGPLTTLRTQMTNLYQKSGPMAVVGGIGYSNKDNNIASVSGVAYSMIGESTPGTFYEALTEGMMEDGFLSRFLIIEYDGKRPPMNQRQVLRPDESLTEALVRLATHAQSLNITNNSQLLLRTEESAVLLSEFERECDKEINSTTDESRRQMWNRAGLKVLRVAGLLAVADNYINPCIDKSHVVWALDCVRRDIGIMGRRLDQGDVGLSDFSRERKIITILREYLVGDWEESYKVPKAMQEQSIIPRAFIQIRITRVSAFYRHRLGAVVALEQILNSCINNGYLMEVEKAKLVEHYNYHGKAYRIIKLPDL